MLKFLFVFIVFMHGLIHFLGFAKALDLASIPQFSKDFSRLTGFFWLFAGLIFMLSGILLIGKRELWLVLAVVAIIFSQLLIFSVWQDAKFGTIPNILILLVAILYWGSYHFENSFQQDVRKKLEETASISPELIMEKDLEQLPDPVKRYLKYAGVLLQPKIKNVRIVFEGDMRAKNRDWFPFSTEQYNFFDEHPARLFFMKAKMFGLTVPGYHKYQDATAIMDIRLFGLFSLVYNSGESMNKTETVTLFNDMCLMAPATLIDKRIEWIPIDNYSAEARFSNQGISISALLKFNSEGQLIDFISEDRTDVSKGMEFPFSTPVSGYKSINGIHIMTLGDAIWHYPEGEFIYGKFRLKTIEYNVAAIN